MQGCELKFIAWLLGERKREREIDELKYDNIVS